MKRILFVGSNNGDMPGGLRSFEFDCQTGGLRQLYAVPDAKNPVYMAVHSSGEYLYVAEDVSQLGVPKKPCGVSVYKVYPDGRLERLHSYALAPTVPCHVSLSADQKYLLWAEYRGAHAGIVAVNTDFSLTPLASVHHTGRGPNPERQEAAHCHYARFAPDGQTILVCDLGLDRVFAYRFDAQYRALRHIVPSRDYIAEAGSGPRHLAFLAGTDIALLVCELSSTISSLRIGAGAPVLVSRQNMVPESFTGFTKAAAVKISPDGEWVLASNRGHDSIASYRIDRATGELTPGALSMLAGSYPRDLEFSPDGRFVVVGHKMSDEIAVYAFDSTTGALSLSENPRVSMVRPLCFVFKPGEIE